MKLKNIKFNSLQEIKKQGNTRTNSANMNEIEKKLKEMETFISLKLTEFKYPESLHSNISIIEENNWVVPLGTYFLDKELFGLQRRYNISNLVPFAINDEGNEFACFIIDKNNKTNNQIAIINSFGSIDNLIIAKYDNITEWIKEWF